MEGAKFGGAALGMIGFILLFSQFGTGVLLLAAGVALSAYGMLKDGQKPK